MSLAKFPLRAFSLYTLCLCACVLSRSVLSDSETPWAVACQAPLSMGFSRQGCWSGLPFPSPGDLPDPGIAPVSPVSPALQADSLLAESLTSPSDTLCWSPKAPQSPQIWAQLILSPRARFSSCVSVSRMTVSIPLSYKKQKIICRCLFPFLSYPTTMLRFFVFSSFFPSFVLKNVKI